MTITISIFIFWLTKYEIIHLHDPVTYIELFYFEINILIQTITLIFLELLFMAYALIPRLDDMSNCEWINLTDDLENIVVFCQRMGLIPTNSNIPCTKNHDNWYLGKSTRASDQFTWRCQTCKSTRWILDNTFFTNSKLELLQILDLIFYWSQNIDSHEYLRRHCQFAGEATIVD